MSNKPYHRMLKVDDYRNRYRAFEKVAYLIRKRHLPKANTFYCAHCGSPADHWHHHLGYAPPYALAILPLCVNCHRHEHKQNGIIDSPKHLPPGTQCKGFLKNNPARQCSRFVIGYDYCHQHRGD